MNSPDKVITSCPSCESRLSVLSTAAGKKIRCPKCNTVVTISADIVSSGSGNSGAGSSLDISAAESRGNQPTFHGQRPNDDSNISDGMEVVDLSTRYSMEGVLGQGGMGKVMLATDNRLKRKVAIKRVLGDMAKSQIALRRFMTEAQSIAALNHPNIVQVYDYGRDKEGPFLILEYVDGRSLLERCTQGVLPPEEAINLVCQLCDGLAQAHELGIIHRDLKPANVLLTKDGVPKLTDFGLARMNMEDAAHTISGTVLGTLDFMPPEQRRDASRVDARSDLWSLAATLYQMLTGKSPKVIRLNEVPTTLQPVLGKALEDQPAARYGSVIEFRNALREALSEGQTTLTQLSEGQCPSCRTKNELSRKFCRKCAVSLEMNCLSCSKSMPVWDEVCGSCGTRQSPLITARKQQMQQRQEQAEHFIREGRFREAELIAAEIHREDDPRFQHLKEWADDFPEGSKREQRRQQERAVVLYKEALTHHQAHDYPSAIHSLEQISAGLRSADINALLKQLQTQEERSRELDEEIRVCVERRQLDGLMPSVDELLQLLPERVDLRKLRGTLQQREEQRLAAKSRAKAEAQQLLDVRKYAECVAVLQQLEGTLRTSDIEALQKDAASRLARMLNLQRNIDQRVKNNQLRGLLAQLDELLSLKSEVTVADSQLREQLLSREQKQKAQVRVLLQKAQHLRKEVRFSEAIELLQRLPEELQSDSITETIDDLQLFADQRSAAIGSLSRAKDERQIKKALSLAEEYRGMLSTAVISDTAFESAVMTCRRKLDELQQAEELAKKRRQRQRTLVIVGSAICALILVAALGFVVLKQQQKTAIVNARKRGDEALQTGDYKDAIAAYTDVIRLDDTVADVWAGLALAKLRQSPPDVTGAFDDIEKSAALSPDGEKLQWVRQTAYTQRAIERAMVDLLSDAQQDLSEAEKLGAPAADVSVARSAVAAAYLDRAEASVQQSAVEPALAAIDAARAIQPAIPGLPELQAAAIIIRAQKTLQTGNRLSAAADFQTARTLNPKAAGLKRLAASLAEAAVTYCEETFSVGGSQEATESLRLLAEIDPEAEMSGPLRSRLGKVLIVEANRDLVANKTDQVGQLIELLEALQIQSSEVTRLSNDLAGQCFEQGQKHVAARELQGAVSTCVRIQGLAGADDEKKLKLITALVSGIEPLCLKGLRSQAPSSAIEAVQTLAGKDINFGRSFLDQLKIMPDNVKNTLPDALFQIALAFTPFDAEQAKLHQQDWAEHLGAPVKTTNSIGMTLQLIPPGEFLMGAAADDADRKDYDCPQHRIRIMQPYYMGETEVTQGQWYSVMKTKPWEGAEHSPEGDEFPATSVSWNDAIKFSERLSKMDGKSYRLPTEAEWEYACRGGTSTSYSFGSAPSQLKKYAWFSENTKDIHENYAHKVGTLEANAFGLYDMHGNVWEWCSDWAASYSAGTAVDPAGPSTGSGRVRRGGSWINSAGDCRAAYRDNFDPSVRGYFLGFRLVLSPVVRDVPRLEVADSEVGKALPSSLSSGLIAYYPFNGNAIDESGNGNNCEVKGAVLISNRHGHDEAAYRMQGTGDCISQLRDGANPFGESDFTFSMWVLGDTLINHAHVLFGNDIVDALQLDLAYSDKPAVRAIEMNIGGKNYSSSDLKWQLKIWYQITVVKSGNQIEFLRDGKSVGRKSGPLTNGAPSGRRKLTFAARGQDGHQWLGALDDIRIYNRALSASEIKALYEFESTPP